MIDIQKIETFLCAAEKLNISEAAKQLHLRQPTVSHHAKLLEQELVPYFSLEAKSACIDRGG
jgi:DNA-binding transcriptional LysR family regulator